MARASPQSVFVKDLTSGKTLVLFDKDIPAPPWAPISRFGSRAAGRQLRHARAIDVARPAALGEGSPSYGRARHEQSAALRRRLPHVMRHGGLRIEV